MNIGNKYSFNNFSIQDLLLGNIKNIIENLTGQKEDSRLTQLSSLGASAGDLHSCMSAINSVSKFLSSESKIVREMAVAILILLLKKVVKFLVNSDPSTIKAVVPKLLEVINKIEGNITDSSSGNKSELKEIKLILKALEKSFLPKNYKQDEFVSYIARPLSQAMSNLIGQNPIDVFVSRK